ncbi:hypothetical protein [Acinetobacter rathckeae]|uniref:hypothetical protein n=1 Tax=Acinetobacter rathckeae TaxID=2605272 RepID=UPI0018A26760|nr:hypothetical protein [Acinetobacter rathckeae]MBF7689071.1 hypothetical protein [Acinetobacter rathckeae]MBF7696591.1 hypothetical protein [Acinetobacter rathckeae]
MQKRSTIDWPAWIVNILLIVLFREVAVWIMTQLHHPELGNLLGLISLLICMALWRKFKQSPLRVVDTNNKIMKESAFAFLPICAGALITLMHMGKQTPVFLLILFVSTLVPLWVYAHISKRFL